MSVHNSATLHHHHHHHSDTAACHHQHHEDRQTPQLPHPQGGRRASRGQAAAAASAQPPSAADGPPPLPSPPAMDANGEDAKTDDSPGLPPPLTTQEVTYIDDEDITEILVDRDPFRWHEIVKVKFDDIFGEPDSEIFSFESIWKLSSKVYRTTKLWCYRLLSVIFVVPLVVVWGIVFSCLSFCRVWICVPLLKASDIQLHCLRRFIEALLRTFLAPCFEAVGRCLYHIRLRIIRGDESL